MVLLVGANNFGRIHTDATETEEGIRSILALLHRRLPTAKVLLIGVLPSQRSSWVDLNTDRLDDRLKLLPEEEGPWLRYRDLRYLFVRNRQVNPVLYLDSHLSPPEPLLHPTAQAQTVLANAIEPDVRLMMNDRLHH